MKIPKNYTSGRNSAAIVTLLLKMTPIAILGVPNVPLLTGSLYVKVSRVIASTSGVH